MKEPFRVYMVRSLEDITRILRHEEGLLNRFLFHKIIIFIWVFIVNILLSVIKRIFFYRIYHSEAVRMQNIIVYSVGIVGDNIAILPLLAALRENYPDARITVVTNCQIWEGEGARQVLGQSSLKDEFILINTDPVRRVGFKFILNKDLKRLKCDLFVNTSPFGNRGWFGAVLREMIFAKEIGAKFAVGFRMSTLARKRIFDKVQYLFVKNEPRRYQYILKELGLSDPGQGDYFLSGKNQKTLSIDASEKMPDIKKPLFVISPGAKFESKCWPVEHFGQIARWIHKEYGGVCIISGTEPEKEIGKKVIDASGETAINYAGQTNIQELVELLRLAKVCVTNDTGTMHVAAMVGTPMVAIFTMRNSPTHWFPYGSNVEALFSLVKCRYCYNDRCETKECLSTITTDHVISALEKVLKKS